MRVPAAKIFRTQDRLKMGRIDTPAVVAKVVNLGALLDSAVRADEGEAMREDDDFAREPEVAVAFPVHRAAPKKTAGVRLWC